MTKVSPIVLILGEDSFRADRALSRTLLELKVDPAEIVRIWGDEASFAEVFAAAQSRSLFAERTVVLVRRAERLRGGGGKDAEDVGAEATDGERSDEAPPPPPTRAGRGKAAAPSGPEVPELDEGSTLILMARKADRRLGIWKKISKVAATLDAEALKGKALYAAANEEARRLGVRVQEGVLRDLVDQSGPSLGRIVSELEKLQLFEAGSGRGADELVAVTSAPPLYRLSDALVERDRALCLELADEALAQGEAPLRILATAQGTIRKLALLKALRSAGVPSAEAGAQAGLLPFKVAETERAARAWSALDLDRAFGSFAEADRRIKLSAPAPTVVVQTLAEVTLRGRA